MKKTIKKLVTSNYQNIAYTTLLILVISALINFNTPLVVTKSENVIPTNSQLNQNSLSSKLLNQNQIKSKIQSSNLGFLQTSSDPTSFQYISNSIYLQFDTSKIIVLDRNSGVSFSITFTNSRSVSPSGVNALSYNTNYFASNIKMTNLKNYNEIWYYNIYNKIDLRYYITNNGLKYDFIAHPGSNPNLITLSVSNSVNLHISSSTVNYISNSKPFLSDNNLRVLQGSQLISSNFKKISNNQYGFNIGNYDRSTDLIIDPVISQIEFSTYIGGDQLDKGTAITVDSQGNVYVAGIAGSASFPTKNAFNSTFDLFDGSAFILKLNPSGNSLIYSTFISGVITIGQIQVDSYGNVYAVGGADSSAFPTKNAYNSTFGGYEDVFVLELNPTGNGLVYSTFVGGSNSDYAYSISIDTSGNAYVTGTTFSTNFPTKNGYSSTLKGLEDAFVLELNPSGNGLIYSTLIGGNSGDSGDSILIDSSGDAYIAGSTSSTDFPTKNAYNSTFSGGVDIFIVELNPTGNGLIYSTYIGGRGKDYADNMVLDNQGNLYLGGNTLSSNFPTKNAFNSTYGGGNTYFGDGYVLKLNLNTNSLIYSTYIGGSSADYASSLAVNSQGNAYLTGFTMSKNFPTTENSTLKLSDIFLTILSSGGNKLDYSTLIGGASDDSALAIKLDQNNNVYLTGYTSSTDFPMKYAYNSTYGGNYDAFVLKMSITLPVESSSQSNQTSNTGKGFLDVNIYPIFISLVTIIEIREFHKKKNRKI